MGGFNSMGSRITLPIMMRSFDGMDSLRFDRGIMTAVIESVIELGKRGGHHSKVRKQRHVVPSGVIQRPSARPSIRMQIASQHAIE
jgi:hypothetical protein